MKTFISVVEKDCNIPIKIAKTSDIEEVDKFIEGKKSFPSRELSMYSKYFGKKRFN